MSRLGGTAVVNFVCSGYGVTQLTTPVLARVIRFSIHSVMSIALRLAAFLSGIGFRGYNKLLKRYLGIQASSCQQEFLTCY